MTPYWDRYQERVERRACLLIAALVSLVVYCNAQEIRMHTPVREGNYMKFSGTIPTGGVYRIQVSRTALFQDAFTPFNFERRGTNIACWVPIASGKEWFSRIHQLRR